MALRLHVWVGNPNSVSEMNQILQVLDELTSANAEVVYEKKLLEIYDLAEGFADTSEVQIVIEERAKSLGVTHATAMFGMRAKAESFKKSCPRSVYYLGSFEWQTETEGAT